VTWVRPWDPALSHSAVRDGCLRARPGRAHHPRRLAHSRLAQARQTSAEAPAEVWFGVLHGRRPPHRRPQGMLIGVLASLLSSSPDEQAARSLAGTRSGPLRVLL